MSHEQRHSGRSGSFLRERVPEILNEILHRGFLACVIITFLVGAYCVLDAGYLYYHAGAKPYKEKKPEEHQVVTEDKQISDDQIAWLSIEGTGIDDPVMQADNNIKYLNLDPYGDFALHGSLFMDYRNSSDFRDEYSIIYGHHMEHGLMFGCLDEYRNTAYADDHRDGLVTGHEEIFTFHIFAVIETDAHNSAFFDPDQFDREVMLETISKSPFYHGEPDEGLPILALTTCTDSAGTSRLIVLGTLKEGEQQ